MCFKMLQLYYSLAAEVTFSKSLPFYDEMHFIKFYLGTCSSFQIENKK